MRRWLFACFAVVLILLELALILLVSGANAFVIGIATKPAAPPKRPSELERTYRERLRPVEELSA